MPDYQKLLKIQMSLKVPKDQQGHGYRYRNTEQILQTVKPLCDENGAVLTLTDRVEHVGDRYYVVATSYLVDAESGELITQTEGWAREEEKSKLGMDGAQITGSASSYARKRSLCGLFDIDDEEDNDARPNVEPKDKASLRKALANALKQRQIVANDLSNVIFHKGFLELNERELSYTLERIDSAIKKYNEVKK